MKSFFRLSLIVILGLITSTSNGASSPTRGISIGKAIEAADAAIGFPMGRPESYEVVVAKLFFMKDQRLEEEGIPGGAEAVKPLLRTKQYWLVQYRRWPIRLDGGLAVFVDAISGDVIKVVRDR